MIILCFSLLSPVLVRTKKITSRAHNFHHLSHLSSIIHHQIINHGKQTRNQENLLRYRCQTSSICSFVGHDISVSARTHKHVMFSINHDLFWGSHPLSLFLSLLRVHVKADPTRHNLNPSYHPLTSRCLTIKNSKRFLIILLTRSMMQLANDVVLPSHRLP